MNQQENISILQIHKIINTIFQTLLFGQILFLVVGIFLRQSDKIEKTSENLDFIFLVIVPLLGMTVMYFSRLIFRKKMETIKPDVDKMNRIAGYRTSKIISWAMVEGVNMFSIVAFIFTGNYVYVAVSVFLLGYFFMIRPSKENFKVECNLSESDFK